MKKYIIPFSIIITILTSYFYLNPSIASATKIAILNSDNEVSDTNMVDNNCNEMKLKELKKYNLDEMFNFKTSINGCYNNTKERIELYFHRDARHSKIENDTIKSILLIRFRNQITKYKARLTLDSICKISKSKFDVWDVGKIENIKVSGKLIVLDSSNNIIIFGLYNNSFRLYNHLITNEKTEYVSKSMEINGTINFQSVEAPIYCNSDIRKLNLATDSSGVWFSRKGPSRTTKIIEPGWENYLSFQDRWWNDNYSQTLISVSKH